MKSADYAIQIIPDLSVDKKYAAIIGDAMDRIDSFTSNALRDDRVSELYLLEKSGLQSAEATEILKEDGRLVVGFQFDSRSDGSDDNFQVFVKKLSGSGKAFKFRLTATVQQIMLQLISLEDRRTVAIFSMLNTSMETGYRILTALYGNQLHRLTERVPRFLTAEVAAKLEKLRLAKSPDDSGLWEDPTAGPEKPVSGVPEGNRAGTQDNILQVMADDGMFEEINQYVERVVSKDERIVEKRRRLEESAGIPREQLYEEMVREDLDQLENCYARIHIYLKTFYKKKDKRSIVKNKILRQFFGSQIEQISAETALLEDLLSLNQVEYFKNIDRHKEL
jgi:hypothetical protein